MFLLFGVLLVLPILNASSSKFPTFRVSGTLTCRGDPIKGNIIMIDDNFLFTDHLLTERKVGLDGKFSLAGEPTDDCLDVKLYIQHKCHDLRIGRGDNSKLKGYSEFSIHLADLINSKYDLTMNIELHGNEVRISSPFIPTWRAWLYGKRMVSDTIDRIRKLNIWNNI